MLEDETIKRDLIDLKADADRAYGKLSLIVQNLHVEHTVRVIARSAMEDVGQVTDGLRFLRECIELRLNQKLE